MLNFLMALVILAAALGLFYVFKDWVISFVLTGFFMFVLGAVFSQYILWVAIVGLVFMGAVFGLYFLINDKGED